MYSTSTAIRYFSWKIYFRIFQLIIVLRMEMTVNLICLEIVLYFSHRLTWQTQEQTIREYTEYNTFLLCCILKVFVIYYFPLTRTIDLTIRMLMI